MAAVGPTGRIAVVRGTVLFNPDGTRRGDGDSLRILDPRAFDDRGRPVQFVFRHVSPTSGSLPVRLLGLDTPELTYSGASLPGLGMPNLHAFPGGVIPEQEPWGHHAKAFVDAFFQPGDSVSIELDERVLDRNQRLLGYVFRGQQIGDPAVHLNLLLLRQGLAALFQVLPNVRYLAPFRAAVEAAQRERLGLWPHLQDTRPLTVDEVRRQVALNPPVVYRKVIDAFIAGVPTDEALRRAGRWVGDVDTRRLYRPERWHAVPHARRAYFERPEDGEAAGYQRA